MQKIVVFFLLLLTLGQAISQSLRSVIPSEQSVLVGASGTTGHLLAGLLDGWSLTEIVSCERCPYPVRKYCMRPPKAVRSSNCRDGVLISHAHKYDEVVAVAKSLQQLDERRANEMRQLENDLRAADLKLYLSHDSNEKKVRELEERIAKFELCMKSPNVCVQ